MHLYGNNNPQIMESIMSIGISKYLQKALKLSAVTGLVLSLSGCIVAVPPAIQLASLALDGVSYIATGKSVTDHAISGVTNQDCAMLRGLQGDDICTANDEEIAMPPNGTALPAAPSADDAARTVVAASEDASFQTFSATQAALGGEDQDEILDLIPAASRSIDMQTASGPML